MDWYGIKTWKHFLLNYSDTCACDLFINQLPYSFLQSAFFKPIACLSCYPPLNHFLSYLKPPPTSYAPSHFSNLNPDKNPFPYFSIPIYTLSPPSKKANILQGTQYGTRATTAPIAIAYKTSITYLLFLSLSHHCHRGLVLWLALT